MYPSATIWSENEQIAPSYPLRGTVLDGLLLGISIFVVKECVFDRSRTFHLVHLFEINAKYASVIQLAEALDYVNKVKRLEGRKTVAS